MHKIIIGVSGKKGSGKDTFAKLVMNKIGHGKQMAFAAPIKEIAAEYFNIPRELSDAPNEVKNKTLTDWLWEEIPSNINNGDPRQYWDNEMPKTRNHKEGQMTVREVLQWIGTEIFRENMHRDFWIKATLNRIKRDKSKVVDCEVDCNIPSHFEDVYFVTDVRFPNEAKAIKEEGGLVIRVYDRGLVNTDNHPSEISLDGEDINAGVIFLPQQTRTLKEITHINHNGKSSGLWEKLGRNTYDFVVMNEIKEIAVLQEVVDHFYDYALKHLLEANANL